MGINSVGFTSDTNQRERDCWYVFAVPDKKDTQGYFERAFIVHMHVDALTDRYATPTFNVAEMSAAELRNTLGPKDVKVNFELNCVRGKPVRLKVTQGSVRLYPEYSSQNTRRILRNARSFTLLLKEDFNNDAKQMLARYYTIAPTGEIGIMDKGQMLIVAASYTITNAFPKQNNIVYKKGPLKNPSILRIGYNLPQLAAPEISGNTASAGMIDMKTYLQEQRRQRMEAQMLKHMGSRENLVQLSRKQLDMIRVLADNIPYMLALYRDIAYSILGNAPGKNNLVNIKLVEGLWRICSAFPDCEPAYKRIMQIMAWYDLIPKEIRKHILTTTTAGTRKSKDSKYADAVHTGVVSMLIIDSTYSPSNASAKQKQMLVEQCCIHALTWNYVKRDELHEMEVLNEAHKYLTSVITLDTLRTLCPVPKVIDTEMQRKTHFYNALSSSSLPMTEKLQNLRVLQQMSSASLAMYAAVIRMEPHITPIIERVCTRLGLKPEGLNFRLKLPVSTNVKEAERLRMQGKSETARLNSMNDCLRYTIIVDPSKTQYPAGLQSQLRCWRSDDPGYYEVNMAMEVFREILAELTCTSVEDIRQRSTDWKITRMTNYWKVPNSVNPYNGLNCTFSYISNTNKAKEFVQNRLINDGTHIFNTPFGMISFEVQIHTPESFALKNGRLHELYEESRLPTITPEQLAANQAEGEHLANQLRRVAHIDELTEELCKNQAPNYVVWWASTADDIKQIERLLKAMPQIAMGREQMAKRDAHYAKQRERLAEERATVKAGSKV